MSEEMPKLSFIGNACPVCGLRTSPNFCATHSAERAQREHEAQAARAREGAKMDIDAAAERAEADRRMAVEEMARARREQRHAQEMARCKRIEAAALNAGYEICVSHRRIAGCDRLRQWRVAWHDPDREVASATAQYRETAWTAATSRLGVHMAGRREVESSDDAWMLGVTP